jgi:hypothetical protein
MIVNYEFSVVNEFGASLTDDTRVVIYDRQMFIVQATGITVLIQLDTLLMLTSYQTWYRDAQMIQYDTYKKVFFTKIV